MGRPPKVKLEEKVTVIEESVPDKASMDAIQIVHDIEKKLDKKAIEGKEINELIEKKNQLVRFINDTNSELSAKERALRFINVDIENAQKEVEKIKQRFDQENAEKIKDLNDKQAKLEKYIQEYQAELDRAKKYSDGLEAKFNNLATERKEFDAQKAGYVEFCENETARIAKIQENANEAVKALDKKKKEVEKAHEDLKKDADAIEKKRQELSAYEQKLKKEEQLLSDSREQIALEKQRNAAEKLAAQKEAERLISAYRDQKKGQINE